MVKLPSKSLDTPLLVFCSTIVAPGSGIPLSSETTPVTVFCAITVNAKSIMTVDKRSIFLMLYFLLD